MSAPAPGPSGLRSTRALVDLDRLEANYQALAAACRVPLMPVVKAEAYGHGAAVVARRCEAWGAPLLAVAYVEEAVALRAAGVAAPLVVLAGFEPGQASALLAHDLTPVIATPAALQLAVELARGAARPLAVHLKLDTGMSRLGLPWREAGELAARLAGAPGVELAGLMTHLASADEAPDVTEAQLDRFDEAVAAAARRGVRPRWVHAVNSAALERVRPTHTLARPGLLLYGLRTRPLCPEVEVRPVMSVLSRIALVKQVPAGTAVSYGGRWVARRPSRIATVPMGYADGVPRTQAMAQTGQFLVRGQRVPLAGSVCMDLLMLDVTDHPEVAEGDDVVFFGDQPGAWEVAERAGTIAWETLTSVGPRVPRVYVQGGRTVEIATASFAPARPAGAVQ